MRAKYLLLYTWELQKTMSKDISETNINMFYYRTILKKATTENKLVSLMDMPI